MQLALTNVVSISVAQAQQGIGAYNTSNLAIFTRETPGGGFGDDGYKIYLDPTEVTTDFGTDSKTAQMANAVFSQNPNVLAGNGYLVVIPFVDGVDEVQHLAFSGTPASGVWSIIVDGVYETSGLDFDATASEVQTAVRLLPGCEDVTVTGDYTSGFDITFVGVGGDLPLVTTTDTLQTSAPAAITITPTQTTAGTNETIGAAVTRTKDLVQYFGITAAEITMPTSLAAGAAIVQPLNKIAFWISRSEADVESGGTLDDLAVAGLYKNRGLFYGADNDDDALVFMASYAARGLSTQFNGSNTTQTMHLKDMIGVLPDPSMTQTLLGKCLDAGVDTYVSLQGVPKVFTSGENRFFDQVYNQEWFTGALQVAYFNALAQAATKIPQTEDGMDVIKAALRTVCLQGVTNQYMAPGTWTAPNTFGNQPDFFRNISEVGFYIYSLPVAQQLKATREAREAPIVQIAIKEAGAIQKGNVIIFINP